MRTGREGKGGMENEEGEGREAWDMEKEDGKGREGGGVWRMRTGKEGKGRV